MVDKINPAGSLQNVLQTSKSSPKPEKHAESAKSSTAVDEVVISEEAISLSEAESTAKAVSQQLSSDGDEVLSSDEERLNALA